MNYWNDEDINKLEEASSFKDIAVVALDVQKRMGDNLVHVCGPISTGGVGNRDENIFIFKKTIKKLISQGWNVYDQTPFEITIRRLRKKGVYPVDLLEDVYRPLFESGIIKESFFIYGWESSRGSCWEHDVLKSAGIKITYLPKNFV